MVGFGLICSSLFFAAYCYGVEMTPLIFCVSYCIILVYLYTLDHRINIRVKPVGNGRCVHAKSYCIPPLLLLLLSSLSREHRMYNIFTRHQISTHLE